MGVYCVRGRGLIGIMTRWVLVVCCVCKGVCVVGLGVEGSVDWLGVRLDRSVTFHPPFNSLQLTNNANNKTGAVNM